MTKLPDQTPRKLTKARKKRIVERDGNICATCGDETFEPQVDHWVPLFLGGSNDDDNLRVLCQTCHVNKGRTEAKVRGKIRRSAGLNKPKRKKKIQSRGFDKRFKRKINGKTEMRREREKMG